MQYVYLFFNYAKENFSKKLVAEIIGLVAISISITAVFDASYYTDMISNLFESFSNVTSGTGTFSTRTMVWAEMLSTLSGIDVVIGHPFGTSLNISWTNSAHSGYVDYIMVTGYIGTGLLIGFCVYLIMRSFKQKQHILSIMIISLLVYWYGYGFSIEQAALLGGIMAILHRTNLGEEVAL